MNQEKENAKSVTQLVINFIQMNFPSKQNVWELLIQKAQNWLIN